MSIKKGMAKKFFATAAAGAVALIGLAGVANAASPAQGTAPGEAPAGSTGSLTIHKRLGLANNGSNHNGLAENAGGEPLDGVTFKIEKVDGVDLTTQAGWDLIDQAQAGAGQAPYTLSDVDEAMTANGGELTFSDLEMGLYKVTEVKGPDGMNLQLGAPFFVTIPYPSKGADGTSTWVWDVQVYPKNSTVSRPAKSIGEGINIPAVGGTLNWTITSSNIATMLQKADADEISEYRIEDTLVEGLKCDASTVSVNVKGGDDFEAGDFEASCEGNKLVIKLTDAGLAKLNALGGEAQLEFNFSTLVTSIPEDGNLDNEGIEYVDGTDGESTTTPECEDDEEECTPPETSCPPGSAVDPETGECVECEEGEECLGGPGEETKPGSVFGKMELTKVDATQAGKVLDGAEFEIYTGTCDARGEKVSVNGKTVFPTVNGKLTIEGLWIGNYNQGDPVKDRPSSAQYCLVETKAPAGYQMADKDITVYAGSNSKNTVDVENTKITGPTLPLTGAAGTALLIVGGLALIGLAGSIVVTSRRRSAENA